MRGVWPWPCLTTTAVSSCKVPHSSGNAQTGGVRQQPPRDASTGEQTGILKRESAEISLRLSCLAGRLRKA